MKAIVAKARQRQVAPRLDLQGFSRVTPSPIGMSRRRMLETSLLAGICTIVAPMFNKGRYVILAGSPTEYSARAIELMGRSTVIDMLSPFAISPSRSSQWLLHPESFGQANQDQFRASGIRIFHIAIGSGGRDAYDESIKFFGLWNGFIANQSDYFMRISNSSLGGTSRGLSLEFGRPTRQRSSLDFGGKS